LIADDHDFFRSCLVDLVNSADDLEIVGECRDGAEVATAVHEVRPEVVWMDVTMPVVSGLEALDLVQQESVRTRGVMLTSVTAPGRRVEAQANGAVGYLVKGSRPHLVFGDLRQVVLGGTAWPRATHPGLDEA